VTGSHVLTVRGFAELRRLRHELAVWMTDLGIDEPLTSELVLAVTEVATNAIEASPAGEAQVQAETAAGAVRVVVLNEDPRFRGWTAPRAGRELSERGRGLRLAAELADSLEFDHSEGRTEATLTKRYA
jgi:anti-sigma regulatory factor (Ser/Thr protein kinase)